VLRPGGGGIITRHLSPEVETREHIQRPENKQAMQGAGDRPMKGGKRRGNEKGGPGNLGKKEVAGGRFVWGALGEEKEGKGGARWHFPLGGTREWSTVRVHGSS